MPGKKIHVRAVLLLALTLGGCSVSGVVTDWVSEDVAGPEPSYYRYLVSRQLDGIVGHGEVRKLEISPPRRVDLIKGASWLLCLKYVRPSPRLPPLYYSIIIQREKIVKFHIAVFTDECETQPYTPFDWKEDQNHPPPQ